MVVSFLRRVAAYFQVPKSEKSLQSEYFQILCKRTELHPPGLLAGGASAPYKRFHRR